MVDTEKNASSYFRLVNDFYGNLPIPAPGHSFYRGYFIQSLEPGQLIEKIEKQIASGKCSGQDEQKLKELAATLTENDNNVLFVRFPHKKSMGMCQNPYDDTPPTHLGIIVSKSV